MNQPQQPQRAPLGAEHAKLEGAPALFRYRSRRLSATNVSGVLVCDFHAEGRRFQGIAVRDISATGLSLKLEELLPPGTQMESLHVLLDGAPIWKGRAEIVHSAAGGIDQVGVKFTSGILDLDVLRFCSDAVNSHIVPGIEQLRLSAQLPTDWRADVAHYVRLFAVAREALDTAEVAHTDWRNQEVSRRLCRTVYEAVVPEAEILVRKMDKRARSFDKATLEIALAYGSDLTQAELGAGEFLRRAYEKPLGYAGDYWMMELLQMEELRGETLYSRFLHMYASESAIGQAVLKRGHAAQRRISEVISAGEPVRIMSLACGPAIEIRRLLREHPRFETPVEFLLVDQDEQALRACHEGLSRALNERDDNPPVRLSFLHFSLRQIIAPKRGAEANLVAQDLRGVDLIYSMGLFDYLGQPLARRCLSSLYGLLNTDGGLFIGNLMRVPESSWVAEYCMAWHLQYRTENEMLDLISGLDPMPNSAEVVEGASNCLFLNVRRDS